MLDTISGQLESRDDEDADVEQLRGGVSQDVHVQVAPMLSPAIRGITDLFIQDATRLSLLSPSHHILLSSLTTCLIVLQSEQSIDKQKFLARLFILATAIPGRNGSQCRARPTLDTVRMVGLVLSG